MKFYTGATLLINENDGWWLSRGVSNPHTVWVDATSGVATDKYDSITGSWLVPALGGMPSFTELQIAIDRILPKGMFRVLEVSILNEQPSYSKGYDAFILVKVESIEDSSRHLTETEEFGLFTSAELVELEKRAYDYAKPTFSFMSKIADGLPSD